MKKTILIMFCLIFALPSVIAWDGGFVGENMTVWSEITANNLPYPLINANITIRNSSGDIVITNQTMTQTTTGLFSYIYNPSSTGNHISTTTFYNSTGVIAIATETLEINNSEETRMAAIAIIIALIGLVCITAYSWNNIALQEVPSGRILEKGIFYALLLGGILTISGFITVYVNNVSSLSYLIVPANTLFIINIICVAGIVYGFSTYLIETIFKTTEDK